MKKSSMGAVTFCASALGTARCADVWKLCRKKKNNKIYQLACSKYMKILTFHISIFKATTMQSIYPRIVVRKITSA